MARGNCKTANIVYAVRCDIHGDVYNSKTGEELKERFIKHRYYAKNRTDNSEIAAHIHKHQHKVDKDITVLILKGNLYQKHQRELWEDKFICLLCINAPKRLNIEWKHYRHKLYEAFTDLTA